jgi:CMP-N-acetylneuraminic acid synthetase
MRHDSERVPGKNWRELGGRPLYRHVVETLLLVDLLDSVVIDTDSRTIADDAAAVYGDRVRVVPRPEHLRSGMTAMNDVLLNVLDAVQADWVLQTHSTNPFLRPTTVDAALRSLWESAGAHDSLFAATRRQSRYWWPDGTAINHDPTVLLRTQDLRPVLEENSNMYIFTPAGMRKHRNRIGASPLIFEMDALEAWDIDDQADFQVAESIYASALLR